MSKKLIYILFSFVLLIILLGCLKNPIVPEQTVDTTTTTVEIDEQIDDISNSDEIEEINVQEPKLITCEMDASACDSCEDTGVYEVLFSKPDKIASGLYGGLSKRGSRICEVSSNSSTSLVSVGFHLDTLPEYRGCEPWGCIKARFIE
tara:strand:+ start:524 stop:967 length:444 start_codon:yes stop_codon:yes gene_type:complete